MIMSDVARVLVADIGGTNTRLAMADRSTGACEHMRQYPNADYESLEEIVCAYRADHAAVPINAASFAIAGPVTAVPVRLTNLPWEIAVDHISRAIGGASVHLLNDFQALALALPHLKASHLVTLNDVSADPDAPRLVLGPGTGLGVSTLVKTATSRWIAIPGEGGHINLPIVNKRDFHLYEILMKTVPRVSVERVLSGSGMVRLYRAIATLDGEPAIHATPEAITGAAKSGTDLLAERTIRQFVVWLARVTANIALITLPRGGIYLGGGISAQIRPWLEDGTFLQTFSDSGRMSGLLRDMPIRLIIAPAPALIGAAIFAGGCAGPKVSQRGA